MIKEIELTFGSQDTTFAVEDVSFDTDGDIQTDKTLSELMFPSQKELSFNAVCEKDFDTLSEYNEWVDRMAVLLDCSTWTDCYGKRHLMTDEIKVGDYNE